MMKKYLLLNLLIAFSLGAVPGVPDAATNINVTTTILAGLDGKLAAGRSAKSSYAGGISVQGFFMGKGVVPTSIAATSDGNYIFVGLGSSGIATIQRDATAETYVVKNISMPPVVNNAAPEDAYVTSVAISADDKYVAVGFSNGASGSKGPNTVSKDSPVRIYTLGVDGTLTPFALTPSIGRGTWHLAWHPTKYILASAGAADGAKDIPMVNCFELINLFGQGVAFVERPGMKIFNVSYIKKRVGKMGWDDVAWYNTDLNQGRPRYVAWHPSGKMLVVGTGDVVDKGTDQKNLDQSAANHMFFAYDDLTKSFPDAPKSADDFKKNGGKFFTAGIVSNFTGFSGGWNLGGDIFVGSNDSLWRTPDSKKTEAIFDVTINAADKVTGDIQSVIASMWGIVDSPNANRAATNGLGGVFSTAWHPNGKLLSIGGWNTDAAVDSWVRLFDVDTATASPTDKVKEHMPRLKLPRDVCKQMWTSRGHLVLGIGKPEHYANNTVTGPTLNLWSSATGIGDTEATVYIISGIVADFNPATFNKPSIIPDFEINQSPGDATPYASTTAKDQASGLTITGINLGSFVTSLATTKDGKFIFATTGTGKKLVVLKRRDDGTYVFTLEQPFPSATAVNAVAISYDDKYVAVANQGEASIQIFSFSQDPTVNGGGGSLTPIAQTPAFAKDNSKQGRSNSLSLAWHPKSYVLLAVGAAEEGTPAVQVGYPVCLFQMISGDKGNWNVNEMLHLRPVLPATGYSPANSARLQYCTWHPSGSFFAIGCGVNTDQYPDHLIYAFSPLAKATPAPITYESGFTGFAGSWSPDGQFFATGSDTWGAGVLHSLQVQKSDPKTMALSGGSTVLLSAVKSNIHTTTVSWHANSRVLAAGLGRASTSSVYGGTSLITFDVDATGNLTEHTPRLKLSKGVVRSLWTPQGQLIVGIGSSYTSLATADVVSLSAGDWTSKDASLYVIDGLVSVPKVADVSSSAPAALSNTSVVSRLLVAPKVQSLVISAEPVDVSTSVSSPAATLPDKPGIEAPASVTSDVPPAIPEINVFATSAAQSSI